MRVYVEGKSHPGDRRYSTTDVALIAVLSVYCAAFFLAAIGYLFYAYPSLQAAGVMDETVLLQLCVVIGIVGAITRGASQLYDDVGAGTFDSKQSLSTFMRPIEGGGMAILVFFFFRALLLVLQTSEASVNPWAFLSLAVVAGLFSHRAPDRARQRFGRLLPTTSPTGKTDGR